jgi:hypothetical protein
MISFQQIVWALQRLFFFFYVGFCLLSVVGGYLTAPLFTYYFFGDWRFWRYVNPAWKLFFQGWRFILPILKGTNGGFMFSVPPASKPDPKLLTLHSDWEYGATSCGWCTRCCTKVSCPILDKEKDLCLGYNSFFWRYFNCGRFPSQISEITYFDCPKWEIIKLPPSSKLGK